MRVYALALFGIAAAALTASIETADARINCGPGMNSNGYACVPIARRHGGYRNAYGYYRPNYGYHRRGYGVGPQGPRDCGPGMNSNGYGCIPARGYYRY